MSEINVTQEDVDAANKWAMDGIERKQFAIDFAAHRQAAVAKCEAEIVGLLKERAERLDIMASDDMAAGHPRYTAKHSAQARVIRELIESIQTPPQGE